MEITLREILEARDHRAYQQQQLLQKYGTSLLCFTMNIAGPVKTSPLIERGFRAGLAALDSRLPADSVLHRQISTAPTGCEAMYAVSMAAPELKALCTAIEESCPLGRLFDMDVLDIQGKKLERKELRGCMVCGAPGRGCAASRQHSISQLQAVTTHILKKHFAIADREKIAAAAVQSLLDEVYTTPKPGLVDCRNNGSHRDMSIGLFKTSAKALAPYFSQCVQIGQDTAGETPAATFALLRQAGLAAEQAMYQATHGINTHKGVIYTLGILCGACGRLWTPDVPIAPIPQILCQCADMTKNSVAADFAAATGSTAGERLYQQQGCKGIRGEVAAGLPTVANIGLPAYQAGLKSGLSPNDAGAVTLLHLITSLEDTNLHHRGGSTGAAWAAESARQLLQNNPYPSTAQLEALDDAFIARNLSPGGCADMLAVTYFLHNLAEDE